MPIQITLIGLGRTGASLGLALKRKAAAANLKIVGHDADLERAKAAQAGGALDAAEWNLPAACDKADAIVLCVPLSALKQALEEVAPHARAGCVITDTAPLKGPVLDWAAAAVPENRYFIGGAPVLNPAYLHDGSDDPRADLFEKGLWALVPEAHASPEALKLVNDLALLAGASPFFVSALEFDSLMAGVHTLPALSAAALFQVVSTSADWADNRRLADRMFATGTAPAGAASPAGMRAAAMLNRENVLRVLDEHLAQLTAVRKAVAEGQEAALDSLLIETVITREAWLQRRRAGNWEADELPKNELPTAGGMMRQMIGLGRWGEAKKDKK